MIISVILLITLLLLTTYFIFWPLYKNRPVLLIMPGFWVVYGINSEQISTALKKAATMGRADYKEQDSLYLLSDYFKLNIISLGQKFYILSYSSVSSASKTKLLKTLFKKMLSNYFIAQPATQ